MVPINFQRLMIVLETYFKQVAIEGSVVMNVDELLASVAFNVFLNTEEGNRTILLKGIENVDAIGQEAQEWVSAQMGL